MRLLLTGATSPLGTAIAAHFAGAGHHVRGLVRTPDHPAPPTTELVLGDINDRSTLLAAARDVDVAIHCAASHAPDLAQCRHINVTGTQLLCDALLASPSRPRLVHVSTVSVYDDAAGPSYDETSPLTTDASAPYSFTKAEAERVVGAARERGLAAVVVRPAMILSLHSRARWGPRAVERARRTETSIVPFPELSYTHESNVVAAIELCTRVASAAGRTFNVVDGVADTREYLAAVYAAAGKPAPALPADAPDTQLHLRFAAERARRELDWRPVDRWREFLDGLRALPPPARS